MTLKVFFKHVIERQMEYSKNLDLVPYNEYIENGIQDAFERKQIKEYQGYDAQWKSNILDYGAKGMTICILEDKNRNEIARGYAFCSVNDVFNRKVGRKIAENRAKDELKKMGIHNTSFVYSWRSNETAKK